MRSPAWLIAPLFSGCMMAPMAVMHTPDVASPPSGGDATMGAAHCPMVVPGTQVAAVDTPDGVALVFTTGPGGVEEVRQRAAAMAERHEQHHKGMGEHAGMMGGTGMMGGAGMMGGGMAGHAGMNEGAHHDTTAPPPSTATVQPIDGGARIQLTPLDAADLPALRSHVHAAAERMQGSHSCSMDQSLPGGAGTSPPTGHGSH